MTKGLLSRARLHPPHGSSNFSVGLGAQGTFGTELVRVLFETLI